MTGHRARQGARHRFQAGHRRTNLPDELLAAEIRTPSIRYRRPGNRSESNNTDGLRLGDRAFFYHSGIALPGIVGMVEVVRAGYPDATAFDPASPYHDPGSTPDRPRWYQVDVRLIRRLRREVTLGELKRHRDALGDFALLRRGNRLSILPVTAAQWAFVLELENP